MNTKQKNSLINIFLFLFIPYFLFIKEYFTFVSLYVVLLTAWVLFFNRSLIKKHLQKFISTQSDIKKLRYHFIKDLGKSIDCQSRLSNISVLNNIGMISYIVGLLNIAAISSLLTKVIGESKIIGLFNYISILLLLIFILWGWLCSLAFKYTTVFYCTIPLISLFVYSIFEPYLNWVQIPIKLCIYLFITGICYIFGVLILPLHILRKLNTKTVIISAILTILSTVLVQSSSLFTSMIINEQEMLLTKEMIQQDTSFPKEIINFLQNEDVISIINHFIKKEVTSEFTGAISLLSAGITLSFLIGGLLVTLRLSNAKKKAKATLYTALIGNSNIEYNCLVKCAYLGGDEYENIIVSNPNLLKIVKQYETTIILPPKIPYRIRLKKTLLNIIWP
ncbi:hypothetical protein BFC22_11680 [Carnobacterium divergens]|uniref:hypothetical protein n=1 Tax=Carnobacterium divergens TaxID=2748 RepID=UPI000E7246A7|nr:hypothetical protein [Carnobacterium divergens]AOA00705.1 hypothetical protein BFC22_11680 [Carnobacterium divergens]